MRNRIVDEKITREREEFIGSIERQAICDLASSYHDSVGCKVFRTTHGSFNVCFFVEFNPVSPGGKPDRWVIRIPFPGRVPWIDEKIDSEVATMKLVLLLCPLYMRKNTTIPIPDVIAYSYVAESPIGVAFIIMECIEGTTLHVLGFRQGQTWESRNPCQQNPGLAHVHNQLADMYIQLRGLEFPEIGALGMPTIATEDIRIHHQPLPIEVLLQHVEGLDPSQYFLEKKTFKTSSEYIRALVNLASNQLKKTQDPDFGPHAEGARDVLYAYYHFCKSISERSKRRWPKSSLSWEWRDMESNPRYLIVLALLYPSTISEVY
ncbi:hypothetical protein QBC33DRAFT_594069 [Phialemonium atrogriseum]|uniref:Aminoglycoside phosphotransferase domain-containing protein n=1 Tax=Phialemonium atrogriseum TaxID=1093897 RepID=A0AAJ0FK24_9PEZI|nr:uncharacterized protein QBC33DRAFT_594069 [Phialemonium atrogriseum]KAK1765089.1 hypothetical protein QBC33DRAFT_594069 [Phialemonium atrogriseum]